MDSKNGICMDKMLSIHKQIQTGCYIWNRRLRFSTNSFAGITMKVPFVMHDCDANPGLVTRKLAPFAKSISIAFDIAKEKLNNAHCYTNGNPIRKEFSTLTKEKQEII